MKRLHWLRELARVAPIAFAVIGAIALTTERWVPGHPVFHQPIDHQKYIYMATHDPFGLHIAPWGWRVLTPLLARSLPFGLQTSFFAISFVSLSITAVLMHFLARSLGFSFRLSLAGMLLLLGMGWATRFNLMDFWLTDPLSFAFTTGAMLLAVRGRWVLVSLALGIGAFVKETVLLAAAFVYGRWARRPIDLRVAGRTVAFSLPAIAVLIALRVAIPQMNDDPAYVATVPHTEQEARALIPYDYTQRTLNVIAYRIRSFSLKETYAYSVRPWGFLAAGLALYGAVRRPVMAARLAPLLVMTYAQVLVTYVDTSRVLAAGFPAVVILALHGAAGLRDRSGTPEWRFVAASAATILLLLLAPGTDPHPIRQAVLVVVLVPFLTNASLPGNNRTRA